MTMIVVDHVGQDRVLRYRYEACAECATYHTRNLDLPNPKRQTSPSRHTQDADHAVAARQGCIAGPSTIVPTIGRTAPATRPGVTPMSLGSAESGVTRRTTADSRSASEQQQRDERRQQ
jgi:hypothetical protein